MKDINKHISKALEPYKKESLYNLPIDLIAFPIIIIITLILFPIVLIEEIPLIILVLLANYRITILGMIEQKKDNYIQDRITMIKIKDEYTNSSKYVSSVIPKLYPENKHYGRYKIICRTKDGKRLKLRSAVSGNNWKILYDNINKEGGWERTVTYGKYSKIIVSYDDKDDEAHVLTHRLDNYKIGASNNIVKQANDGEVDWHTLKFKEKRSFARKLGLTVPREINGRPIKTVDLDSIIEKELKNLDGESNHVKEIEPLKKEVEAPVEIPTEKN